MNFAIEPLRAVHAQPLAAGGPPGAADDAGVPPSSASFTAGEASTSHDEHPAFVPVSDQLLSRLREAGL